MTGAGDPEASLLAAFGLAPPALEKTAADEEKGSPETASVSSHVTSKNIFKHPDAHPVVLDLLLLRRFGPEFLIWEPETLQLLVPSSFGHPLSDINLSKLQAMKTLHLVDTYWKQWEIFLWCTMPLNGEFPDFVSMQAPSVAQCLVSIDIANRVREDVPFSDEVKGFLEAAYLHDGVFLFIPPTPPLEGLHPSTPVEGLPTEAELKKIHEVVGADRTRKTTGNALLDEQLKRRMAAEKYLEDSRARLDAQMRMVDHV